MSTLENLLEIVLGSHSAYGRTLRRNSCRLASISAQYALTRARAIREPSMHADRFIALMRDTAPRNCCTKLK